MGDPKFARKKYERPSHPWRAERIASENELVKKFGLKNKKEVWKAQSILKQVRSQSRTLQARLRTGEPQAQREADLLIKRLARLGMLPEEGATLNDILSLDTEAVLNRRFQTLFYMKGMARSAKQARQFIVHGHASIGGRKVTVPGYIVPRDEEQFIDFYQPSPLANDLHPMRMSDEDAGVPTALIEDAAKEAPPEPPAKEEPKKEPKEEEPVKEKPAEADAATDAVEEKPAPEKKDAAGSDKEAKE